MDTKHDVRTPFAGRIVSIDAKPGDDVRAGAPIMRIGGQDAGAREGAPRTGLADRGILRLVYDRGIRTEFLPPGVTETRSTATGPRAVLQAGETDPPPAAAARLGLPLLAACESRRLRRSLSRNP